MKGKDLGHLGEEFSAKLLEKDGFKICERNYRCRLGEIDIIAQKDRLVYFVEVKTRRENNVAYPCQAVDKRKQSHLRKAAQVYMADNHKLFEKCNCEFMVMEITVNEISDAF